MVEGATLEPQPTAPSRIGVIDAFRAIAILAVMAFHYTYRFGPLNPGEADRYGYAHPVAWFSQGWLGVEFFFIISGFVIFMTVEKCSGVLDFAVRRAGRLYPAYVVCMTITFVVMSLWGLPEFRRTPLEYLIGLSMVSEQLGVRWVDGAYWSLLVELKFYFWIALLYFPARRFFVPVWIGFSLLAMAAFQVSNTLGAAVLIVSFMPFFTAGMGFYLQTRKQRIDWQVAGLWATAFLGYVLFWHDREPVVHVIVAAMALVFELFALGRLNWLANPWLLFVGAVSYPFYLLHENIGVTMIAWLNKQPLANGAVAVLVAAVTALALAWLIHRWVEKPAQSIVRRLVRRLPPARLRPAG